MLDDSVETKWLQDQSDEEARKGEQSSQTIGMMCILNTQQCMAMNVHVNTDND